MPRLLQPPPDHEIPSYLPVMPVANPGVRHRPQSPESVPHREDMPARFPHAPTDAEVAASRLRVPPDAVLAPSPVYPERHADAPAHPPTASNESAARWIPAPASQGPRPQPDAGPVTVVLGNATRTSGGSGPGPVTVPAAEAASLCRSGLARMED